MRSCEGQIAIFSWPEMAKYDLRAIINYVTKTSGQNVYYIGHSMGTLTAFVQFSQDRELATKVRWGGSRQTEADSDDFLGEEVLRLGTCDESGAFERSFSIAGDIHACPGCRYRGPSDAPQ